MSNKDNPDVIVVHGAWSTSQSFNHIINFIRDTTVHRFEYDCQRNTAEQIVSQLNLLLDQLSENNKTAIIIGHSFGGMIALACSTHSAVSRVITVGSPSSGMIIGPIAQWLLTTKAPILSNVFYNKGLARKLRLINYRKPVDVVVTTSGFNPLLCQPNDGVVTVESQDNWLPDTAILTYIDSSHYEVLQSNQLIQLIIQRVFAN